MKTILGLFALLLIAIVITINALHNNNYSILPKGSTVTIDKHTFSVDVAKTQASQEQGLSGRRNMAIDHGMLFVFNYPAYQTFWMKDMLFPLDMLFIKGDTIVTIYQYIPIPQKNAPDSSLPVYISTQPTDKVLELNSGVVKSDKINIGDRISYSL